MLTTARAILLATSLQTVYKQVSTNMQSEFDVLRDVTSRLDRAEVPYMLTGSIALSYYTVPRMTRDIDVVLSLENKAAVAIVSLFQDAYYIDKNAVTRAQANESVFNIIHNEALIKVDCIVRKNSEYRRLEFERRREVTIQDVKVWIVSVEDLIISKLWWAKDSHSELQLRDVQNLLASGYDAEYLKGWTNKLGLDDLLKECQYE